MLAAHFVGFPLVKRCALFQSIDPDKNLNAYLDDMVELYFWRYIFFWRVANDLGVIEAQAPADPVNRGSARAPMLSWGLATLLAGLGMIFFGLTQLQARADGFLIRPLVAALGKTGRGTVVAKYKGYACCGTVARQNHLEIAYPYENGAAAKTDLTVDDAAYAAAAEGAPAAIRYFPAFPRNIALDGERDSALRREGFEYGLYEIVGLAMLIFGVKLIRVKPSRF